ncbi:MAG: phosphoglucosamine mutase [Planctomycetes bacterium]|nr:phosphoglucosamine mutase [Planctomycetota bacterium]
MSEEPASEQARHGEPQQVFGTDGVRGRAGEGDLAPGRLLALARAVGAQLQGACATGRPRVLLARDSRVTSDGIAALLAAGLMAQGVDAEDAGILPTPGLCRATARLGYALGLVVSASHNPAEDNGVKLVGPDGRKAPDAFEREVERRLARGDPGAPGAPLAWGALRRVDLREAYLGELAGAAGAGALAGMRVVLDAAHGATGPCAAEAFRRAGARVVALNEDPDGARINDGCGALHPESLCERARLERADLGCAFDGDGDRAILADSEGHLLDGDHVLAILARALRARGRLTGDTVVGTVMANVGLEVSLRELGVRLQRTPVGDRHVADAMAAGGYALGGEQSGHIILSDGDRSPLTGDGLRTALTMAALVRAEGKDLRELARCLRKYPQTLVNVRVGKRPPLEEVPEVRAAARRARAVLGSEGRLVLRYSGTEPLARVMVEGPDMAQVEGLAREVARAIRCALGDGEA